MLSSFATTCNGMRIVLALSANPRATACRIHQLAYVKNFETPAVVELLRRAHQPERPLLDQIQERQAPVAISLRDRHHQTKVGLHHRLLRAMIAALDPLCQLHLLCRCQQIHVADVLQEQVQRVERSMDVSALDAHKILLAETRASPAKADIDEHGACERVASTPVLRTQPTRDCAAWSNSDIGPTGTPYSPSSTSATTRC